MLLTAQCPASRPVAGPTPGAPSNWLNEQIGPSGGLAFDRKEKEGRVDWEALPNISNLLCEEGGESSAPSGSLRQDWGCEKGWGFGESRHISF